MDVRRIAFESDLSLGKEGLLQRFVILEEAIHVITDVAEARLWNRFRILAKLKALAALKGFTHDILWASLSIGEQKAYDNLNSLDFRAWLKLWGAGRRDGRLGSRAGRVRPCVCLQGRG